MDDKIADNKATFACITQMHMHTLIIREHKKQTQTDKQTNKQHTRHDTHTHTHTRTHTFSLGFESLNFPPSLGPADDQTAAKGKFPTVITELFVGALRGGHRALLAIVHRVSVRLSRAILALLWSRFRCAFSLVCVPVPV